MFTATFTIVSLLTACGEKSPSAVTPAAAGAPKISMTVPDGAKPFVAQLIETSTSNFSPTDSDGAVFEYTRLQFAGDGTWSADGYVEAMDEKMECSESGTWSVEEARSSTVATISWTLTNTSCVGRDKGSETRAEVTVGKAGIENALFR